MRIQGACVSDTGIARRQNEDAVFLEILKHGKETAAVGAVFDGIGGLDCGREASQLLKKGLTEWVERLRENQHVLSVHPEILYAHFKDEAELLNEKLRAYMEERRIRTGTTMSAILISGCRYFIIQVGDSRIYRFNRYLEQLTDDEICYEESDGRYMKKLTNYMGKCDELDFLGYQGAVQDGDVFLFCSDGCYHHLLAADLGQICSGKKNSKQLESGLWNLVNKMILRGERDNISAGIICCKKYIEKEKKIARLSKVFRRDL